MTLFNWRALALSGMFAGLALTVVACGEAQSPEAARSQLQAKGSADMAEAVIVCRDGVQYLYGWSGSYKGGPFVTARMKPDGTPYLCEIVQTTFEEVPVPE